jgi:hypothetical protein
MSRGFLSRKRTDQRKGKLLKLQNAMMYVYTSRRQCGDLSDKLVIPKYLYHLGRYFPLPSPSASTGELSADQASKLRLELPMIGLMKVGDKSSRLVFSHNLLRVPPSRSNGWRVIGVMQLRGDKRRQPGPWRGSLVSPGRQLLGCFALMPATIGPRLFEA